MTLYLRFAFYLNIGLSLLFFAPFALGAGTGAAVNETVQQTLNVGPSRTFTTIQAAVNSAAASGVSTKILVDDATYRESVTVPNGSSNVSSTGVNSGNDPALIIQAAHTGQAVLTGSDAAGWEPGTWSSQGNNKYTHTWPYHWGQGGNPWGQYGPQNPVVLRREMVFVGGNALEQKMSLADIAPGMFVVTEGANGADGTVTIQLPSWLDFSRSAVEVTTRLNTLAISKRSNVVLRGLVIQHDGGWLDPQGYAHTACTVQYCHNVLIDQCKFLWNNWGGLGLYYTADISVTNLVADYNGNAGFGGGYNHNLFQDASSGSYNEISYNNWRGAQGYFYGWDPGNKLFVLHASTIKNTHYYQNQCIGFWLDTDIVNVLIDGCSMVDNLGNGLDFEACPGPNIVQNTLIRGNNDDGLYLNSAGDANSNKGISLSGSTIYDNVGNAITADGGNRTDLADFETGVLATCLTRNLAVSGSRLETGYDRGMIVERGNAMSGSNYTGFLNTYSGSSNTFYDPLTSYALRVDVGQDPNMHGDADQLSGWQTRTGQDGTSTWSDFSSGVDTGYPAPTGGNGTGTGLHADYFNSTDLSGTAAVSQTDARVHLNSSNIPSALSSSFKFSARWTGQIQPRYSELYTFFVRYHGGIRLYVNDILYVDEWTNGTGNDSHLVTIPFTANQKYNVKLEYSVDSNYPGWCYLSWASPSQQKEEISTSQLYPTTGSSGSGSSGSGGSLTGSSAAASGAVNLTTLGTADWAHYGYPTSNGGAAVLNRKSGGGSLLTISSPNGPFSSYDGSWPAFSWTDGSPTASVSQTPFDAYVNGAGAFTVTAPAGTDSRTLLLYVSCYASKATFKAHLSDGSAPDYTEVTDQSGGGHAYKLYTLTYKAASANQSLTVTWAGGSSGNVSIGGVALQAGTSSSPAASLSGSVVNASGSVNLTALGQDDWAHFGNATSNGVTAPFNHRSSGGSKISISGSGATTSYDGYWPAFSWTDGTPTQSVSGTPFDAYLGGNNSSFSVSAPADTVHRTLTVYVSCYATSAVLTAHMSDSSSPDYVATVDQTAGGHAYKAYTLKYNAVASGTTINVTWKQTHSGGNISLGGVTLTH